MFIFATGGVVVRCCIVDVKDLPGFRVGWIEIWMEAVQDSIGDGGAKCMVVLVKRLL